MSATAHEIQDEVLAAITPALLAADVARLVRVPSPTGAERPAVEELAAIAEEQALSAQIDVHDLPALRASAGCPGEGAERDELEFEGRLGVAVGADLAHTRAALERAVAAADDDRGPATEIRWHSGQVVPAQTPVDDPFVAPVHAAAREQCSPQSSVSGVPYGADMRHFCARGIPCVMLGPPGFERAHAADEFVSVDDLMRVARAIAVTILRFGA